ncbi:MAG TPA: NAD(P)-dependent oxidoreductase [Trebonia sp.]
MKVFVAGGSGALGRRLVPQLIATGHEVVAMTRDEGKAAWLGKIGAQAAVADALDRESVVRAVVKARPEVLIHQLTGLAGAKSFKNFDKEFALTNRLRTEGTDHLIQGARAAGTRRIVAQSYGNWNYERTGAALKTEEDPFDPGLPARQVKSLAAIRYLEHAVLNASGIEGVALRYGNFYGPGTGFDIGGDIAEQVRRGRFPIVGAGTGVWSFAHLDDAASAAIAAMDRGSPGVYNIADDEPAPVSAWLPELAKVVGGRPPRRVPVWLGRLAAGEVGVSMMTRIRGTSNAKAKAQLGWAPRYPTYREGFRTGLGDVPVPGFGPEVPVRRDELGGTGQPVQTQEVTISPRKKSPSLLERTHIMPVELNAYLFFPGNTEQAIAFYQTAPASHRLLARRGTLQADACQAEQHAQGRAGPGADRRGARGGSRRTDHGPAVGRSGRASRTAAGAADHRDELTVGVVLPVAESGISATRSNRWPTRPLVRRPAAASTRTVRLASPLPARPAAAGGETLPSLLICSRIRPASAVISRVQ